MLEDFSPLPIKPYGCGLKNLVEGIDGGRKPSDRGITDVALFLGPWGRSFIVSTFE